tara:strand:+ start:156 stop:374 length:219 start_codon:yes stop_codon:yes gene_type:complete
MGAKESVLLELEAIIKDYKMAPSTIGREIAGDPNFMDRMRDPEKTISTNTLDNVWRFILTVRGQLDLDLEKE